MISDSGFTEKQLEEIKNIANSAIDKFKTSIKADLKELRELLHNPTIHKNLNSKQVIRHSSDNYEMAKHALDKEHPIQKMIKEEMHHKEMQHDTKISKVKTIEAPVTSKTIKRQEEIRKSLVKNGETKKPMLHKEVAKNSENDSNAMNVNKKHEIHTIKKPQKKATEPMKRTPKKKEVIEHKEKGEIEKIEPAKENHIESKNETMEKQENEMEPNKKNENTITEEPTMEKEKLKTEEMKEDGPIIDEKHESIPEKKDNKPKQKAPTKSPEKLIKGKGFVKKQNGRKTSESCPIKKTVNSTKQ